MSDRKREILNSVERIDFFGEDNPQLADELPGTVEMFAANKTNIARLRQAGITSETSTAAGKSQTRSKVARAREIESDLRRVTRTAKIIEKKVPGFENVFQMRSGNLSYQELIDKANAFIVKRGESAAHFTRYGLTDAFFTKLATDVRDFGEIWQDQADAKRASVGATADTEAILEDALETRSELKIAIENHYKNNPAKLAEWMTACHIRRRGETENRTPRETAPEPQS